MKKLIFVVIVMCLSSVTWAGWVEDFESYTENNSYWYTNSPWSNISNPEKHARVHGDTAPAGGNAGTTVIGDNATKKLFPLRSNNVTYSRLIGDVSSSDSIVLTAQVANWSADYQVGHSSWPLANHIVMGGVALGISGDDISYQILSDPSTSLTHDSVTRVAAVTFMTMYDVKIVINQVEGLNNDLADLYYKLSTASDWATIAMGLETGQDLGSDVYIKTYGGTDHRGAMDNIVLVPEPLTMALFGLGSLIVVRKKK